MLLNFEVLDLIPLLTHLWLVNHMTFTSVCKENKLKIGMVDKPRQHIRKQKITSGKIEPLDRRTVNCYTIKYPYSVHYAIDPWSKEEIHQRALFQNPGTLMHCAAWKVWTARHFPKPQPHHRPLEKKLWPHIAPQTALPPECTRTADRKFFWTALTILFAECINKIMSRVFADFGVKIQ